MSESPPRKEEARIRALKVLVSKLRMAVAESEASAAKAALDAETRVAGMGLEMAKLCSEAKREAKAAKAKAAELGLEVARLRAGVGAPRGGAVREPSPREA